MSNNAIPTDKAARKDFWQERITQFQRESISGAQFCREQGLSYKTFMSWRQRLNTQPILKSKSKPKAFVHLSAPPAAISNTIQCRFSDGLEITWNNSTSTTAIAALIQEVRAL